MSSKEEAPRHITAQATYINEDEIPLPLKGRLSLKIIDEKPPGENLTKVPQYDVFNYTRLTVLCGDLGSPIVVDVNYLNYLSYTTFKRQDGHLWYMCHTWTRTWGEGSMSGTTFINLSTGQRHDVPTLSYWRGNLQISPDGNLILIEAGITATSDRQLFVLDISHLPSIDVIHHEHYGYGSTELCDYKFNEKSEFECTYLFFFQLFKDKMKFIHYFGSDDLTDDDFLKYINDNCKESEKSEEYIDISMNYEDGSYVRTECVVKRKRNIDRGITNNFKEFDSETFKRDNNKEDFLRDEKFGQLENDLIGNKFFSDMKINDMTITEMSLGEDFEKFHRYMKKGMFDISSEKCVFCKHKCEYY